MMKVETLTPEEIKIIQAIRLVAKTQQDIQKTARDEDVKRELEEIYWTLDALDFELNDPRLDELRQRVGRLLY